ncbi:MAG: NYN domain-containing protein [Ardenticatenia bacterium]|nr:NYN domain-containing protein [Ardenticatenia bacterium]
MPTYYYGQAPHKATAIKNSVDIHMVIDAMRILYTHENIGIFIFVTGDRDFIPLVNAIRQKGKECVVIGVAEAASSHLAQSADEFLFYHQLADDIRPPKSQADPYEAVPEAVKLARKRGNVPTFGTIKLLLIELLGEFDHTQLKDRNGNGRPFAKFKDFMKECERRGLIQIASSGTVNEVFLPGEDTSAGAFSEPQERPAKGNGKKKGRDKKAETASPNQTVDPFDLLVRAIHEARRRNNLCTMATLKVLMKDLHPGFDERNFVDANGRRFTKFKDLVREAERRGMVQILTTGTVDEVFLPGEDPMKLSRFAGQAPTNEPMSTTPQE